MIGDICGLTLRELGEKARIEQYKTVGKAVEQCGRVAEREPARAALIKRAMREMSNVEIRGLCALMTLQTVTGLIRCR
jgi:hypothetical protein